MPHMTEREFEKDVLGDPNGEEDVMFMSMQDFKKKLDQMSARR